MSSSTDMETLALATRITNVLRSGFELVGNYAIATFTELGSLWLFGWHALTAAFRKPWRLNQLLQQCEFVGSGSLFIILLTGTFTGAVFTLQSANSLETVGMESIVGSMVLIAVSRELAPVLTALMVTGRVASAMATELGTMRVTEQIDAMEVMAVDPVKYLVTPRILASTIMVPALNLIFLSVSYLGSYGVAVMMMGIDEGAFIGRIKWWVDPGDIYHGLVKAFVFGILVALVGCYKGYHASGGARGVGSATTQAVVISSISIFVLDYVLTSVMLVVFP